MQNERSLNSSQCTIFFLTQIKEEDKKLLFNNGHRYLLYVCQRIVFIVNNDLFMAINYSLSRSQGVEKI